MDALEVLLKQVMNQFYQFSAPKDIFWPVKTIFNVLMTIIMELVNGTKDYPRANVSKFKVMWIIVVFLIIPSRSFVSYFAFLLNLGPV